MRNRQASYQLGLTAEERCAEHLRTRGYAILATRLRTKEGEIDLLAQQGDTLVVVEVKARASQADGLYAVTPRQQKRLTRAALAVLADPDRAGLTPPLPPNIRFDVMAVAGDAPPFHLESAWGEDD